MMPVAHVLFALTIALASTGAANARPLDNKRATSTHSASPAYSNPFVGLRTHYVGNIRFGISNWGIFGSESGGNRDYCRPYYPYYAPSFEFPARSGLEYLYAGALWIGGVKGRDTLVSIGQDGWYHINELWAAPSPEGRFVERTTREVLRSPSGWDCPDVYFSDDAISEQDLIAVYYDTLTIPSFVDTDPIDGREHIPLGLKITQSSYAWSYGYADDFIIIDYRIKNISDTAILDAYVGVLVDGDVGIGSYPFDPAYIDDIAGFIRAVPSPHGEFWLDSLNLAWIADNDGDPRDGAFTSTSATGVMGVRFLRTPHDNPSFSWNWWVSSTNEEQDWGPVRRNSAVEFILGNLGTPLGDRTKYQVMSNGEVDYDQTEAELDHELTGWLPPLPDSVLPRTIADGFDTRYVLSTGPFDVPPGVEVPLTIALVAGSNFHVDPANFALHFDYLRPHHYTERLDKSDLIRNALWADWVYDVPGYDTDGDGTRGKYRIIDGDTIYYAGDGIPDFMGPPPPPAPRLHFSGRDGNVVVRWNGEKCETTRDPFVNIPDFEGYRVYFSRTGVLADFALLAHRDLIDYVRYEWVPRADFWRASSSPLMVDSLQLLYRTFDDSLGHPFHPDSFATADVDRALMVVRLSDTDPDRLDTSYYYFAPFGQNLAVDDSVLYVADSLGLEVAKAIRKPYPFAARDDVAYRDDGTAFKPFYEYEYVIDGLYLMDPVYFAVTTFDFGDPLSGVESQESSPLMNADRILPGFLAAVESSERPKPGCYPNPYRHADNYRAGGWEDPTGVMGDPERSRKITFYNLPDTCTIQIWSLDGDLVRELDHAGAPGSAEASYHVWNVITRNSQSVVTGLYIYSVESRYGTDFGKLAVIR